MNRDWIRSYFDWLRDVVRNNVGVPISIFYNAILGIANWLRSSRDWLRWTISNATSALPWPIAELTSFFFWLLWNNVASPLFDFLVSVSEAPLRALDQVWDNSAGWWLPAVWVGQRVENLRDFILWLVDQIQNADGILRRGIETIQSYLIAWVTDWLNYLLGRINALSDAYRQIVFRDLSSIWTAINDVWGFVRGIQIPDLNVVWSAIDELARVLNSLVTETEAFRRDPAGYVWNALESTLEERIRLFLIRIW